ncbi:hypothetical protein RB601_001463 [Gaeumannomyces tritici]
MDPHAGFDDVSPGDAEKKVKEAQESEPIKVGMTVETKDLFRDDHREPWQEWAPDDIGIASKSTPASAKFALIVRREKKNGKTDEPVLALHSITVQSPIIKKLLGPVFAGYRGINTNLKNQEFRAPFHEFFYRWGLFCAAEPAQDQGEEGEVERQHYKLLFDIISPEIATSIDQTKDLLKNGVISFEYVWALFEPGIEVYSSIDRQDRLSLLDSSGYQKLPDGSVSFKLTCRYVGTDGTHFGFVSTSQSISQFDKLMPVVELNVLPSHLHPGIDEIRPVLEEKGKKFESLLGVHHKSYFGFYTLLRMQNGASNKQFGENARIMVDCGSFMRHNSGSSIDLLPLDPGTVGSSRPGDPLDPSTSLDVLHDDYDDLASRTMRLMAQRASRMHSIGLKRSQATSLGKQHYALCTPLVRGYCLTSKKWGYFNVDAIRDITWNELAFKRLVLPHDYKETVLAFVHAQLSHADNFDDVIEGKGQGIIMLLSGEPGTGKTLTSESGRPTTNTVLSLVRELTTCHPHPLVPTSGRGDEAAAVRNRGRRARQRRGPGRGEPEAGAGPLDALGRRAPARRVRRVPGAPQLLKRSPQPARVRLPAPPRVLPGRAAHDDQPRREPRPGVRVAHPFVHQVPAAGLCEQVGDLADFCREEEGGREGDGRARGGRACRTGRRGAEREADQERGQDGEAAGGAVWRASEARACQDGAAG